MMQFDYSSHDWVQLSALTREVTLLHNDLTKFKGHSIKADTSDQQLKFIKCFIG